MLKAVLGIGSSEKAAANEIPAEKRSVFIACALRILGEMESGTYQAEKFKKPSNDPHKEELIIARINHWLQLEDVSFKSEEAFKKYCTSQGSRLVLNGETRESRIGIQENLQRGFDSERLKFSAQDKTIFLVNPELCASIQKSIEKGNIRFVREDKKVMG